VEEQIYKVTTNNGNFYFKDKGHKIRHRIDGPAVETFKGRSGKKLKVVHGIVMASCIA